MVAKEQFHAKLHEYLHRQPFQAFVVELTDGREIMIQRPPVVHSDGAASFIDLEQMALVEFYHDEVKAFRSAAQEVGS